jgi:hypothetical protein
VEHRVDKQLVDEAIGAYVDWREECAEVRGAYESWVTAPIVDAACAFSAYRAAHDREEWASRAYADLVELIAGGKGAAAGLLAPTVPAIDWRYG